MKKIAFHVAVMSCASTAALAGYTAVNTGGTFGGGGGAPSDATSVVHILDRMLTGDVSGNLANVGGTVDSSLTFGGGISARRVQDFIGAAASDWGVLGSNLNLGMGAGAGTTDQVWNDGIVRFHARARYAGFQQYFGYQTGAGAALPSPNGFTGGHVLSITGGAAQFITGPSIDVNIGSPVDFRWMRANTPNDGGGFVTNPQYSRASNNTGARTNEEDHMITYEITGVNGGRHYVIFFEDIQRGGDRDFNDLAVELTVVPLPTASALAGAALVGLAGFRRRR